MPKPNLSNERLIFALIIGVGAGFLIGRYWGNYIFWIALCSAAAFSIETITRVSKERKEIEIQKQKEQKLPSAQFKPPKPQKPPKSPKPPKPPKVF